MVMIFNGPYFKRMGETVVEKQQAEIIYLAHSGFIVKICDRAFVFDYYRDPAGVLEENLTGIKKLYIFSSHAHYDHFSPEILTLEKMTARYILSFDLEKAAASKGFPDEKTVFLHPYESFSDEKLQVKAYGSTDEGVSFAVSYDGWRIFHAGDLNWWHWKGDTEENQKFAKNGFYKQLKHLEGQFFDVAFFPVDGRLEEYAAIGAKEFCRCVEVRHLIAMHTTGVFWSPAEDFFAAGQKAEVWCPEKAGSILVVEKE